MKIPFLIPGDLASLTGGYGYDRRLIAELSSLGHSIEVIRLSERFPFPRDKDLRHAGECLAAIPDHDCVLIDGLAAGAMPTVLEQHAGRLKIVYLCHHPLALESGLDVSVAGRLRASEIEALQSARHVIVTSHTTAATLSHAFGVGSDRISIAVPGTDKFPPAPGTGEPPVLLTVATITRRKAHDVLIEALHLVRDRHWTSQIIGGDHFDPVWAESVKLRVETLGLSDRIQFLGDVHDPAPAFQGATIFVLPSRFEGFGMVFAEALAHGLPVLAARAGAVPDVVPETAGILVPVDDAVALAEALALLLDFPDRRAELRQGAITAGRQLQDWPTTARIVEASLDAQRD